MPQPRLLLTLLLLALLGAAVDTRAALVLYTDRAAWRTAAGGGVGNIVDSLDSGTATRTGYTLGGSAFVAFPNTEPDTTVDGSGHARFDLEDVATGTFTFTTAITALGYDINSHPFDIGLTVLVAIDGVPSSSYVLPNDNNTTEFVGFVSDAPFTSFVISPDSGFAYHGVDNLEAFTVVPEPSTYFAVGFLTLAAGIHFWRNRRVQLVN